jgi:hypothetical protein
MFSAAPQVPPIGWNSLMPSAPGDANNTDVPSSISYNNLRNIKYFVFGNEHNIFPCVAPPSYEESVRRGHFVSIASPENLDGSSAPPESPSEFSPKYPVYSPLPMPSEMVLRIN